MATYKDVDHTGGGADDVNGCHGDGVHPGAEARG